MKFLKRMFRNDLEPILDRTTKQLRSVKDAMIKLDAETQMLRDKNRVLISAVTIIARSETRVSHAELVQMGIAHLLTFDANDEPVEVDEGPRAMLMGSDNKQATNAKFRQLKRHYIAHRKAVKLLMDRLDKLSTSNAMGAEVSEIAAIREELRNVMGKSI